MYRIVVLLLVIMISNYKGQYLKLDIRDTLYTYTIKDTISPLKIEVEIANITNVEVGFILDNKSLGVYESFNNYLIEENTPKESGLYENIFSPRIIVFPHNTSDSLKLDFYLNDVNFTRKALLKEYNRQKKIQEKEILNLKKYQYNYFRNKSLQFVEKAKYINENFMILKPNEKKKIIILFDPKIYKNEGSFNGIGFPIQKDNQYDFIIKIHTDANKTMWYLNNENKGLIKNNIKLISEDLYSKRLYFNTQ